MHNRAGNECVEGETAYALQTNVEGLHVANDVAAWQQVGIALLGSTLRFAEMIRRYRVGVEAEICARIDFR